MMTEARPRLHRAAADDLKLIVGVGPVLEQLLHQSGVTTFEQIAAWSEDEVNGLLPDYQRARVAKERWIEQAASFAAAKARGEDPTSIARDDQIT